MDDSLSSMTAELGKVPELASLGSVFKTVPPAQLTEKETEYVITCTKHILNDHIVLEFIISNTLPEQLLADVGADLCSELVF